MNNFKVKRKPSKPKRLRYESELELGTEIRLDKLLERVPKGIPYDKINVETIRNESYGWDEWTEILLTWKTDESDEDFHKRENVYKEKLKEYNKWLKDNKPELDRIEEEKKEQARLMIQKQMSKLKQELEKL